MSTVTPAFFTLLEQYRQLFRTAREMGMRTNTITDTYYSSRSAGVKNFRLKEPFTIGHTDLYGQCTRAEWCLVGQVMSELYENNALWHFAAQDKRSNSTRALALRGLIAKGILIPTETKHFYLANPFHIRRGGPFEVLASTANMLMNRKPQPYMLKDKKPVREFDFSRALPTAEVDDDFE